MRWSRDSCVSQRAENNVIRHTKNQSVTYIRDALGRETERQYSDGFSVTFAHDAPGNVTGRTDRTGAYVFVYDALGRTLSATAPVGD